MVPRRANKLAPKSRGSASQKVLYPGTALDSRLEGSIMQGRPSPGVSLSWPRACKLWLSRHVGGRAAPRHPPYPAWQASAYQAGPRAASLCLGKAEFCFLAGGRSKTPFWFGGVFGIYSSRGIQRPQKLLNPTPDGGATKETSLGHVRGVGGRWRRGVPPH